MKDKIKVTIDGEEYDLFERDGQLWVGRGNYEGHFAIVAQKEGRTYPITIRGLVEPSED